MLRFVLVPAVLLAACTGKRDERGDPPSAPPTPVRADAAVPPADDAGITALPTFDPATGFHLDDTPIARPGARITARDRKLGQLLLRSTPTGAIAAVDGVRLGPTPVLWEGVLDGQTHEFTFVMAGHTLARYRFVPVTSGVVHGTLVKLTDDRDAGVPDIPSVLPRQPAAPKAPVERRPPPAPPPPPPPPSPTDAGVQDGL